MSQHSEAIKAAIKAANADGEVITDKVLAAIRAEAMAEVSAATAAKLYGGRA